MNYEKVLAEYEAAQNQALARAYSAEHWVAVHQWVFVPAAFVVGLVLGAVWL